MTKTLNMTQGQPVKLLLAFALPLMFGNIFQQLYTVVDTAIVGHGVGMDALAALGTVDWLNWMMIGIAQGFTQGFSVRISQKYGEGDWEGLKWLVAQSALLAVGITVLVTLFSQVGLPVFLKLLHVPDELKVMAELYSRMIMGGFAATMFFNLCSAVLRAVGNSQTPLKAMMVASVTNIVLDCAAVFVLGWGIAGAAAATVFSQCVSGSICAVKIWKTEELRFEKDQLSIQPVLCKDLLLIGAPVAVQNMIIALGGMMVQMVVNGFGMSFIAGFTASNKLYGLLEIAAISYGYAVTTYVGQNYGAKEYGRIRQGMQAATLLSIVTAVFIAVLMIVFGRNITMLFISSDVPELMTAAGDTAYRYLFCMAVFLPVLYLLYVYQASLRGLGNTVAPMISGMIEFVLRVSIALGIGATGYENGIFGAEVAAWCGAAVYLVAGYYWNMRKRAT